MSKTLPTATSLNHSLAGMSALTHPTTLHSDLDRAEALLQLAIGLVESAVDILQHHITTDGQLTKSSLLMPGGSVGKHFRHVIETFRAFLLPLEPYSRSPSGSLTINYDAILPTTRQPVARSVSACRKGMTSIRSDLKAWGDRSRTSATDRMEVGEGVAGEVGTSGLVGEIAREVGLVAVTPTKQEMKSSVGRELWFCSLHAIHHFSMLRTIAVHELGLDLPVEFGTAPSTLLYRGPDWNPPPEKKEVRAIKSRL